MPPGGGGDGMSAEEKRAVAELVAVTGQGTADTSLVLHVLRECKGDVSEAAMRLVSSARPARERRGARRATASFAGAQTRQAAAPRTRPTPTRKR